MDRIVIVQDGRSLALIGVRKIEKNHQGLKIIPYHAVALAFGEEDDREKFTFGFPPDWARQWGHKLIEMADAAERLNLADQVERLNAVDH